ncbi:phage head-binding domain-containing protein [Cronobacter sakazakii]|uniref:phage head-binding domain-containing protein n=1 Tax=Cronobacter sakazakii TaxID=28141 RepID=UPI00029BAF24|nr:phage head-binding domain-containing protein [Cronobacter sakazakii]CCK05605.1 Phage tail fibers [Cronobacter sakazakii 696]
MTDITANVVVSMPSQLFTMARSFKAVANGKIYIGQVDTDPVNPENQIQVYVENEDGSHVPVSQPIIINAAGYPVYNGQIAKFVTVQNHSMAVYDAYGAQQFYYPDLLKYSPDQLRAELSGPDGASLVGYGDETVKDALDNNAHKIDTLRSDLAADDGFRHIGNFLNLEALRDSMPLVAGEIVYVASAASATATEKHYGGGYFQSFDNSTSQIADDGGIVIVPSTGTLAWRRINFTAYDMQFWGVKPDGVTDNAEAITKACGYAKNNHVELVFPSGNVKSSEAFPFHSKMSVRGAGRESSFFSKTTNNKYFVDASLQVDALLVMLPDVYNPAGHEMDTFCFKPKIEGITFQRDSLTVDNLCNYGMWGQKLAAPIIRDANFYGAYIGLYGEAWFLFEAKSVQCFGVPGRSYAGVSIAKSVNGKYVSSGTSLNFDLVNVVGFANAFIIANMSYSSLRNCTGENISRLNSEPGACVFSFINPYGINMTACSSEGADAIIIRVIVAYNISGSATLVVDSYQMVNDTNPAVPTRPFYVDSANAGVVNVTFVGGDIRTGGSNYLPPLASGPNCNIKVVGASTNAWDILSGATYREL